MHLQHNKPSALLVANTKLANEWSANRCVPHISSDWLEELLADPAGLGQMNSMAKIRLLLAGLLALDKAPDVTAAAAASAGGGRQGASEQQQQQWAELQHSLQRLRDVLGAEADEWVKVMAAAAGPLDGRLHLDAVMQRSPAVSGDVLVCLGLPSSTAVLGTAGGLPLQHKHVCEDSVRLVQMLLQG